MRSLLKSLLSVLIFLCALGGRGCVQTTLINEEAYKHLATKADLSDLHTDFADLRAELRTIKWMVGLGIPASAAIGGLTAQLLSQ